MHQDDGIFPRSQTPFGNALAEATPLPISRNPARVASRRAIELRRQWRSQMEFGNEEKFRHPDAF